MNTRDEAIRTTPEGRLWITRNEAGICLTRNGVEVDSWAGGSGGASGGGWCGRPAGRPWTDEQFEQCAGFSEIDRPATLPPASGDLPDGTRVRVTYEGVAESWWNGNGLLSLPTGAKVARSWFSDRGAASLEVLALPEPPRPDPLAGEPGSRWVDPETDTHWVRRVVENSISEFTQVTGDLAHGGALVSSYAPDSPIIGRLVPSEVSG